MSSILYLILPAYYLAEYSNAVKVTSHISHGLIRGILGHEGEDAVLAVEVDTLDGCLIVD